MSMFLCKNRWGDMAWAAFTKQVDVIDAVCYNQLDKSDVTGVVKWTDLLQPCLC